jgi:hypothetical protein
MKMASRRLLHVCAIPMALVLLAGLARAQAPQQRPADAPSGPALELPTDEPIDLSTPEPDELKAARPFVDRPVASPWDSKAGIDYRRPSIPATNFQPDQLTAGAIPDQSTGVAWATVTAPGLGSDLGLGSALGWDKTAIETRVDPSQEQGQLGTRLSRSVPVGDDVSVTVENGVSVTRSLPSGGAQSHGWASSQALRFNVLPTDTTVSIGADISSTDDKWLRTLSAEQKLFGGPFSVTGSVSETPTGDMSKSLRAGFKRTW